MRWRKRSPKRSSVFSMRRMSKRSLPMPRIMWSLLRAPRPSGAHLADRGFEADEDRLADQEMADIEFAHLGMAATGADVIVAQAVAGMAFQAELAAQRRAACAARASSAFCAAPLQLRNRRRYAVRPPARPGSPPPRAGARSASMNSETRMPASRRRAHDRRQLIVLARRVEPAFGGALLALLRHEAGGMRLVPQRDRQHLVGRRHLEIERERRARASARSMSASRYGGDPRADAR